MVNTTEILDYLPSNLAHIVDMIESTVQANHDVIAVNSLSVLASFSKTLVYDNEYSSEGLPIIIYTGFFTKSGGGKTAVMRKYQGYMLDWLEKIYQDKQIIQDKRKSALEQALKSSPNSDNDEKIRIQKELASLQKPLPDVFLEISTQEGIEQSVLVGSTPVIYMDNFGQILAESRRNDISASLLRTLDNIFDSGRISTKRVKGENKRSIQIKIENLGLHLTSTIGDSNLRPQDILASIENGFLNKVIFCFQNEIHKDIPFQSYLSSEQIMEIESFAKSYYQFANQSRFYLSDRALEVYRAFHDKTSNIYINRYNNDEDLAGQSIRQLNLAKRISCIFEIATQCTNTMLEPNLTAIPFDKRELLAISDVNMHLAIKFLEYIQHEHLSKILLYAKSTTGKIGICDIIVAKAKSMQERGETPDARKLHQKLSKKQREQIGSVEQIKRILQTINSKYE